MTQLSLIEAASDLPDGFDYRAELITPAEEAELVAQFAELDFREFEFHGYLGKRRVVSFGFHYDFSEARVQRAADIPDFLLPLRERPPPSPGSVRRNWSMRSSPNTSGSGNRLAPRPAAIRRRDRHLVLLGVPFPAAPQTGERLGAQIGHPGAALSLSAARPGPPRMGAQHSARRPASLLGHLPQPRRACRCQSGVPAPRSTVFNERLETGSGLRRNDGCKLLPN